MVSLGVAAKQKDRARRVFQRSAERAGFFEHGNGRLVMPGVTRGDPSLGEDGGVKEKVISNIGGRGGPADPLIAALISKLTAGGTLACR